MTVSKMDEYLHSELPPISLRTSDIERLQILAEIASEKYPRTADFLAREIERAHIVPDSPLVPGLVVMGSEVSFHDDVSRQERTVTLVYPEDADVAAGKISILTPIGSALIGLSVGQTIEFQTPAGGWRSLTVLNALIPAAI